MKKNIIFFCFVIIIWNCASLSQRKINDKQKNQIHFQSFPEINKNGDYGIQINIKIPNALLVFQKINNKFVANYQISIAILDSNKQQINHYSWNDKKSETYYDATRNINNYISTGYFFKIIPSKYSISILIEDLDSKYRSHKKIAEKIYHSEFISPTLSILNNQTEKIDNYASNIIPDKTEKIYLNISHNFKISDINSYMNIQAINDNEVVLTDSILIKQNRNKILYPIVLSEFWLGKLILILKYNNLTEKLTLELPQNNIKYWKNIETTIQIMGYIFTSSEYRKVQKLSKKEKITFVKNYWEELDPTPNTEINEIMNEFFSRIEFTNLNFSELGPGWQSDRGRIYIIFGQPQNIEISNENNQGYKYIIWHYPSGKQFIFIDEGLFGNYRLFREIN